MPDIVFWILVFAIVWFFLCMLCHRHEDKKNRDARRRRSELGWAEHEAVIRLLAENLAHRRREERRIIADLQALVRRKEGKEIKPINFDWRKEGF